MIKTTGREQENSCTSILNTGYDMTHFKDGKTKVKEQPVNGGKEMPTCLVSNLDPSYHCLGAFACLVIRPTLEICIFNMERI